MEAKQKFVNAITSHFTHFLFKQSLIIDVTLQNIQDEAFFENNLFSPLRSIKTPWRCGVVVITAAQIH